VVKDLFTEICMLAVFVCTITIKTKATKG